MSTVLLSGLAALLLAITHIAASRFKFLKRTPRSRWLSLSSGVSVAYVFIHVLPDLGAAQTEIQESIPLLTSIERHVYVMALIGMMAFYGLERAAKVSRKQSLEDGEGDSTQPGVFWLHMVSFALYNGLIGYLLMHREEPGVLSLVLYAIAMALHFLVNDYSMWEDHKRPYTQIGRWILSAAVICGWVIGTQTEVSPAFTATLFSLLAGGVILNVLKEELPQERESRFWTFTVGAVSYAGLLLVL